MRWARSRGAGLPGDRGHHLIAVIGMALEDGVSAVNLFENDDEGEFVLKG